MLVCYAFFLTYQEGPWANLFAFSCGRKIKFCNTSCEGQKGRKFISVWVPKTDMKVHKHSVIIDIIQRFCCTIESFFMCNVNNPSVDKLFIYSY